MQQLEQLKWELTINHDAAASNKIITSKVSFSIGTIKKIMQTFIANNIPRDEKMADGTQLKSSFAHLTTKKTICNRQITKIKQWFLWRSLKNLQIFGGFQILLVTPSNNNIYTIKSSFIMGQIIVYTNLCM